MPQSQQEIAAKAEAKQAAAAVGLRYVSDARPGFRRRRSGKSFSFLTPEGARLADRASLKRIRELAVPPAWTEVWICPFADGHLQATGRDDRGRKQYKYHPRFREVRESTKYEHVIAFAEVLPAVRTKVRKHMTLSDLPRDKVLATIVYLLDKTLIRVGNDEYVRENRSYGLTTLRRRHLKIDGSVLRFSFRGKSGVEHTIAVADPRLARIIQRCRDLPGQELFQYLDPGGRRHLVTSDDVNDYLRELSGRDITAKDFRTWGGTMLAAVEFRRQGPAASRREADRNVVGAIDAVAERLGNTRAVCRKYYVHPALISAYLMGETIPQPPAMRRTRRHRGAALRRDEVVVLQFLQERL